MKSALFKYIRLILAASIIVLLLFTFEISAFAAPKQMPDGGMFDAEFYSQTYPDVAAAVGTDETALYNHYVQFGKAEGRKAYADDSAAASTSTQAGSATTADTASVYDKLIALKTKYPEGMSWTTDNTYTYTAKTDVDWWRPTFTAKGCAAFAYTLQDEIFGTSPSTPRTQVNTPLTQLYGAGSQWTHNRKSGCWVPVGYDGSNENVNAYFESVWPTIKTGDVLADGIHAFMVLTKSDNSITVVEGNYNGTVHWGREITKEQLRMGLCTIETF